MSSHKLRENGQTCRENQALSDQSVPLHLSISIFLCTFQREGISLIWISIITNHTRDSTVFLWTIQFTSQVLIPVWRRANARNVNFVTIYGSQFTLSTQLIKLNYPLTIIAPLSKSSRFFWILKNDRSLIISKTESCIMVSSSGVQNMDLLAIQAKQKFYIQHRSLQSIMEKFLDIL